jgi:hypothetical protein
MFFFLLFLFFLFLFWFCTSSFHIFDTGRRYSLRQRVVTVGKVFMQKADIYLGSLRIMPVTAWT